MTITAYNTSGQVLGSQTRLFDATTTMATYNANIVFLGLLSDQPIHHVDLTATMPLSAQSPDNIGWDNLIFGPAVVPEPGGAFAVAIVLAAAAAATGRRRHCGS
jgi:hypothetical protein